MAAKTPLTIITGYLGAGKTTLLRHILVRTNKKLAVVMNEFGRIGIDSKITRGKAINMVELAGGCVCCSLTGEFEQAIKEILDTVKPEWIVMETTGTAEPDAILLSIEDFPSLRLDAVVTVIDADAMVRFPQISRTAQIQVEMADLLLINKADLVTDAQIRNIGKELAAINDRALRITAVNAAIDLAILFGVDAPKKTVTKRDVHIPVESFTFSTTKALDKNKFERLLPSLPQAVYRAKGFVVFPDGSFLFNYVAGRSSFEPFPAEKTELVFLGKDAKKSEEAIIRKLETCPLKA